MNKQIPHKFIAIEGNIGTGKTTLSKMLANDFGCKLILEQFTENPFLPLFYQNPERYAFPVELFFMTERHKQLQEELSQIDLFSSFSIADYYFIKTLLFAKNNLKDDEFRLFKRLFKVLSNSAAEPDLLVYLHRPVPELMKYIKQRNRTIEKDITAEYLMSVQNSYLEFFKNQNRLPVLILNVEGMDFKENKKEYELLIDSLSETYPVGTHRRSFVKG